MGGKGHQVDKNVEWIECHRIKTRQDGGPRLISFGTCGRTGPMSKDSIVLLEVQKVIDPVTQDNPRTFETACLDESEFTEALIRTRFTPPGYRYQCGKQLSEDRLDEEDEHFNKDVKVLCGTLQYQVACGPIFTSSYKIELCEEQRGYLKSKGFIAVDMESSRFRRIAAAKRYHVSMVRAYADSCQSFQEADQKSKSEERRRAIEKLAEIFNRM